MFAQIEIMALPNQPLRMSEVRRAGFETLKDYVHSIYDEQSDMNKKKYKDLPLCLFARICGEAELVCNSFDDLPTENIPDILIFD